MRPPSIRSAPGPRALPSVLAGATTAVAAGTLAGWLLPSLAGWGMGAAIAGLSAVAAFAPSLRRPLVCGASALCVLASLPYLAAMLGMGRGCTGFQVPTAVRSACVLAMVTTAGLMLLPVVRERLPGGDGEFLGVGWFGATAALATVCFGGGPAIFHRGAAGAVLMVLLAAVMGVVVGAGPAAAACLSGIDFAEPTVIQQAREFDTGEERNFSDQTRQVRAENEADAGSDKIGRETADDLIGFQRDADDRMQDSQNRGGNRAHQQADPGIPGRSGDGVADRRAKKHVSFDRQVHDAGGFGENSAEHSE